MLSKPQFNIGETVEATLSGRTITGRVVGFEDGRNLRNAPNQWLYFVADADGTAVSVPEGDVKAVADVVAT